MIIHELMAEAKKHYTGQRIIDLRVGLSYTGALLEDDTCGIAFSFAQEALLGTELLPNPGNINGMDALEVLSWAESPHPVMAAAGVAVMNALTGQAASGFFEANVVDILDVAPHETVGMVGHFRPFVQQVREQAKQLYIFDRTLGTEGVLPDWAEDLHLPQCDVVMITGTTIVNKTIDRVLALCQNAREIILLGPTTVMLPQIFGQYGVTLLAGSRVTDGPGMMTLLSQGGGGQGVGQYAQKLTLRLPK